jgi:hypothetical protein
VTWPGAKIESAPFFVLSVVVFCVDQLNSFASRTFFLKNPFQSTGNTEASGDKIS